MSPFQMVNNQPTSNNKEKNKIVQLEKMLQKCAFGKGIYVI